MILEIQAVHDEVAALTLRVARPLIWHDRTEAWPKQLDGATCFFLRFEPGIIGVTANHVIMSYESAVAANHNVVCQLRSSPVFDLSGAIIARNAQRDIATFSVSESILAETDAITLDCQGSWPPPEPQNLWLLSACGFPESMRIVRSDRSAEFRAWGALATDIAALMEAEGIAMRPGPRPVIAPGVLAVLRRGILGMQLIAVRYAKPDAEEPVTWIICPYGILHGGRGWLVAHVEALPEMRLCRLDRIVSADLLDRGFQRRQDFCLLGYARQSFGVSQELPMEVVLRFAPHAAADAAGWIFHPTQSTTRETDGSLTVKFLAGGTQEMCWHLFTWGTSVTIIAPETLKAQLSKMLADAAAHHQAQ